VSSVRALGRDNDPAKGLFGYAIEILEPIGFSEKEARVIVDQLALAELVVPFNVKGSGPEFVPASYLDSQAPRHFIRPVSAQTYIC
jgi:hypothetical protein